jgi:Flp pilus assembly protein TadB
VAVNTSTEINEKIQKKIDARVARYVEKDSTAISERLRQLNRTWDTERLLEMNAMILVLVGVILTLAVQYLWAILSGLVALFMLIHALQGWCPPVPVIRRLGVRTATEIEQEKMALKVLRGDFEGVTKDPGAVLERVRMQ